MEAFKLALREFLFNLTGSKPLTVVLTSMFPLIELKGAIPIGEALGFDLMQTAGLAYLGSTFVCIPIFFLLIPIFNLMKRWKPLGRLITRVENVFKDKARGVAEKSKNSTGDATRVLMWGVYVFVAIPLPLTGVWTGTAIAVFLGLKFRQSILPIALGNLTAGTIITLLTYLFADYVEYIIMGMFIFAIVMLIIFIIKVALAKPRTDGAEGKTQNEDKNA